MNAEDQLSDRLRGAKGLFKALLLLLSIPVVMIGFELAYQLVFTHVYKYRLTIEATVDGKVHAGSGVVRVSVTEAARLFLYQSAGVNNSYRGEAVTVDLGERGVIFALLKDVERPQGGRYHASPEYFVGSAFPAGAGQADPVRSNMARFARGGESRALAPDELPLLVRFRDINDPKTVERVDPANLAAAFGPGVRLSAARIETVPSGLWPFNLFDLPGPQALFGVPITRGIETRLGWLPEYYDKLLDGGRYETIDAKNRFTNSLGSGAFKAGK
jgi:hypothetical protein